MYQKTRRILFFVIVLLFMFLLPAVLLFTFGYKVDWQTLRILKTGLIWVNSSPEGADIFINGKFTGNKTPATISELLPGRYSVSLLLPEYYSWQSDVDVYQGRVVLISNVMLFPRLPLVEKLNFEEAKRFFIFKHDSDFLYYIVKNSKTIHKINADSGKLEEVFYADVFPGEIENIALSFDREKLLCFDSHNIAVIYLSNDKPRNNFVLSFKDNIQQVFWHSDNEHFIVVTSRDVNVHELFSQGRNNTVTVAQFSGKNHPAYYDDTSDTLFFMDLQQASDGRRYENIYKIVIGPKAAFPFLKGFTNQ